MSKPLFHTLIFLIGLSLTGEAKAQHLSFRHLGITEGMPSNVTGHACFDSTGFIWMATNDGLISYDGTRIRQYLKETHPALPRNEIGFLFCDSRNRIWICTNEGLAMMNEQRRITRVFIHDSLQNANIDFCFEVEGLGMLASSSRKTYLLREGGNSWEPLEWFDKNVRKSAGISNLRPFNKTSYLFVMGEKVMLVNFASEKLLTNCTVKNLSSVCKLSDYELLATSDDGFGIHRIAIRSNSITKSYTGVRDVNEIPVTAPAFASSKAANGLIYISTRLGGLIGFDPDHELFYTYRHEPLNSNSISSDFLRWVFCHPRGYLLITSTSGLNYCNVLTPMFWQQDNFIDDKGSIIDGGITGMREDINGNIWIKGLTKLFIWDPRKNSARNISQAMPASTGTEASSEAGSVFRDDRAAMWVAYNGRGLAKFNPDGRLIKFLSKEAGSIPVNSIRLTRQLHSRMLLVGTDNGLFMLHPETFVIDSFDNHPQLKTISKKRIIDILPDGDKAWLASSPGGAAYCYDFREKKLTEFNTATGLSSNRVYCFTKDSSGSIYIGTYDGLNIIGPEGKITIINKKNGLRHPRVENLVTDRQGNVWMTNFNSLICYDPRRQVFRYFDEYNGVSNAGFSVAANSMLADGRILFSNGGLLITNPAAFETVQPRLPELLVHRLYDDGGYELLSSSDTVELSYTNAKLSLYYLSATLVTANRFFYRYKMENLDTGWQQPTKNNQVTYNLRPGRYRFLLQTSYNEGGWIDNDTRISILVSPPWWQTWWFRTAVVLVLAGLVFLLFRRRISVIKQRSAIRQQMAELEGRALRAQMNPHFIFNSLNAIQELIVTNNVEEGYQYLSSFSKLLRMVLNNSEKNSIPLSAEIEMIKLQLSLESLRFKNSFSYQVQAEEELETEMVRIPPLLLQPYVENAVWHGLRHKEGEKNLWVRISEQQGELNIEIEDNGIGRQKAEEIKKQKLGAAQFESKGSMLSLQRIELLNKELAGTASVETIDLLNSLEEPVGTLIKIKLPANLK